MDSILSYAGLMQRAGKLMFGENILDNFSSIKYLFIASDASDKSKERYIHKCEYYKVRYNMHYSSSQLAASVGKKNVKFMGITDSGFAKAILKKEEEIYGKTDL